MDSTQIIASPQVLQLLQRLHALSSAQEKSLSQTYFYLRRLARHFLFGETWSAQSDAHMRDKFVALEPEKCAFVYALARSVGARQVVEAGTSFGVSTIYLALAVGQNVLQQRRRRLQLDADADASALTGRVVATEKEASKAARARRHWKEAGDEVEPWIELREGDLLETLKPDLDLPGEEIDLLLLDIWTPLALPTLQLVQPRLKHGALVITDNVGAARSLYRDFLAYIRSPENGFVSLTVPFAGGLEVSVYLPQR